MPTTWYEGKIIRIEDVNQTVKRFFLEVDGEMEFTFKAGQFVVLDLPIAEKRLGRWRSYSIANAPDKSNVIELCIVRLPGGEGTKYLFEDIGVGDKLKFKGPDGNFCLPENLSQEYIFLCTGTGVAPFRSMIFDLMSQEGEMPKIHLIFGTRTEDGILYRDEFEKLAEEEDWFSYDVALSRTDEIEEEHLSSGYIHPIYMEQYKEVSAGRKFLICGWTKMIDEAVANLLIKLKYDKTQILYELYG